MTATEFEKLFDLDGAVRGIVREELAALLQPSERVKNLHVGSGEQPNQLPGVIDAVRAAFPGSLPPLNYQGLQGFAGLHSGRDAHTADDVDGVDGLRHSESPSVARALTRYVAGAFLVPFRQLQPRAWVRRAEATAPRPSDTTNTETDA